ncbi:hypothetical protein M0802_011000 [Mischocyttarus mexicanus]|nr:hypothetical protein M0802_011000 [Mischocyttarus mexicanus]
MCALRAKRSLVSRIMYQAGENQNTRTKKKKEEQGDRELEQEQEQEPESVWGLGGEFYSVKEKRRKTPAAFATWQ